MSGGIDLSHNGNATATTVAETEAAGAQATQLESPPDVPASSTINPSIDPGNAGTDPATGLDANLIAIAGR